MLKSILLIVIGFILLVKGADFFVDGSSDVARKLRIPELVIGLTIVAFGTSMPEAAVSLTAAFKGNADISIGNVVGSNILNVLIILGITSVITPINIPFSTIKYEIPFCTLITVLLYVLGLNGKLGIYDGLILWVCFIAYFVYLFKMSKNNNENLKEDRENAKEKHIEDYIEKNKEIDKDNNKDKDKDKDKEKNRSLWLCFILIAAGLAGVVLGSDFAVDGATGIAKSIGLSDRFIGLTIVALGTSLPELVTSFVAARKGNPDIAIGNIVGSNIFNILFILGTTSIITVINFASNFLLDTLIAVLTMVLLWICCFKNRKLTRIGGVILLMAYALYFAIFLI